MIRPHPTSTLFPYTTLFRSRSYAVMGRYDDAVKAFAQAAERTPRDPQLLADFADVLAMARGGKLAGEPERLVDLADRKSTRLNSSHVSISYAVFCLKKKTKK